MTAQTFDPRMGALLVAPERRAPLQRLAAWLRGWSVRVELDPHLAADIGRSSYEVPVLPRASRSAATRRQMAADNMIAAMDRHIARDLGVEFDPRRCTSSQSGGSHYV